MAATGAALALFLLAHLAGNLQALAGRGAFLAYAGQLHRLGAALRVLEVLLALTFLLHILVGLSLFLENRRARASRYAAAALDTSLPARLMPYTGLVILLFLAAHLWQFHLGRGEQNVADLLRDRLALPVSALLYCGGLVAVALHTSHGLWSMFQTFGVNHRKYNGLLRCGALAVSIGVGLGFACLPLLALFWKGFLA